jgi:hypothetical protein
MHDFSNERAAGMVVPTWLVFDRRRDRITHYFAAMHFVCFWHKADVPVAITNVRFRG